MTTALELETAAPDVQLRVSRIKGTVVMACLQAGSQVSLAVAAEYPANCRPAGNGAVQLGSALLFLAAGEAQRLFAWLQANAAPAAQEGAP